MLHLRHELPWHTLLALAADPRPQKVAQAGILAHRTAPLTLKEGGQWDWCTHRITSTLLAFAFAEVRKARAAAVPPARPSAPNGEAVMESAQAHDLAQLLQDVRTFPDAMREHATEFTTFAEFGGDWPRKGLRRTFLLALKAYLGTNALQARGVLPLQGAISARTAPFSFHNGVDSATFKRFNTGRDDDHLRWVACSQLGSHEQLRAFQARLWQDLVTVVAVATVARPEVDWHKEAHHVLSLHTCIAFHHCKCHCDCGD
jgi:hypothetical protein